MLQCQFQVSWCVKHIRNDFLIVWVLLRSHTSLVLQLHTVIKLEFLRNLRLTVMKLIHNFWHLNIKFINISMPIPTAHLMILINTLVHCDTQVEKHWAIMYVSNANLQFKNNFKQSAESYPFSWKIIREFIILSCDEHNREECQFHN